MTLLERLRAQIKTAQERAQALLDIDRDLTEAERTEFTETTATMRSLSGRITEAIQAEADQVGIREQQAKLVGLLPAAQAHVEVREPGFRSFGEQLMAVATAYRSDLRSVDPRLNVQAAAAGLNESIGADGGFLVQQDFTTEILRIEHESSVMAGRCRPVEISSASNSIKINGIDETNRANGSRWGGVRGYWLAEAAALTASKPKFRQIELTLHKLGCLVYATDELLADASALESVTTQAVGEELAFMTQDAIVEGDGAGKPLGVLNSNCLVSVAKETGQAADTFVYENAINMYARLHPGSESRATWYYNKALVPQIMAMALVIGTGGVPVFMPPNGAAGAPGGTLFGIPMQPIEQASAPGDKGDIMLLDLSQYILAGKGGVQAAYSIHVQFLTDEGVFRFIKRVDGQPAWASPLTPFKGTANTLSPFITLDARA